MLLRVATEADIEALFEIRTSVRENHQSRAELAALGVTPETIARMLRTCCRAWVASEDGYDVAFSMANAAEATVFAMFLRPGYEGRGLGRALMRLAEEWLFATGCGEIWLLTDSRREVRANGFYRHLGWKESGLQADGQVRFIKQRPAVP